MSNIELNHWFPTTIGISYYTNHFLEKDKLIVFGNLPYNISTEILCKWILNIKEKIWFDNLILMFQKEVADRILSKFKSQS